MFIVQSSIKKVRGSMVEFKAAAHFIIFVRNEKAELQIEILQWEARDALTGDWGFDNKKKYHSNYLTLCYVFC